MDGRYLHRRKHGSDEREYFRPCYRYALAVWCGLVPDVHLVVQSGSYRSFSVTTGIALGISPYMLIALFPAVNGYFFLPNYPTVIAAINFDTTGTTRIGKYLLNHSFMMPGLIATIVSVVLGIVWVSMM